MTDDLDYGLLDHTGDPSEQSPTGDPESAAQRRDAPGGSPVDEGLLEHTGDPSEQSPTINLTSGQIPVYPDVHTFVACYLAEVWARETRDQDQVFKWCPHWHTHRGALERLTALWHAYETLHAPEPDGRPGTGPARWWREHADPTLTALTHPTRGPFTRCGPGRHQLPPPLPLAHPGDPIGTA
jgi:hypothetical protein